VTCACCAHCVCTVGLALAALGLLADVVMAVRDWPRRSTRPARAHAVSHPVGAPEAGRLNLAHPEGVGSVHRRRMKQVRHHP